MLLKNLFNKLIESYIFVLLAALFIGIVFSKYAVKVAPYNTIFLGIIFFFSALKIDLKEIVGFLKDKKMLVVVNLFMLFFLPVMVYYLTRAVYPELAMAFLLLAAMPCGMTTPLLSEICGGKQGLALVLVVTTSLLAPFTIPLVLKLVVGAAVKVSFYTMFLSLAKVIFIPFFLANGIKYFWRHKIKATYFTFKPISIIFLALLIMGTVAQKAAIIMNGLQGKFLIYIVLLFALFVVLHFFGYFTIFWRDKKDRVTITICLTYMNFTLAIYLAGKFFNEPNVVVPVVLSILPWGLMIIPFKYLKEKI